AENQVQGLPCLGTRSRKSRAICSFLSGYPRCELRMALKDKLRVGCSGWGYDDWLGGFYPPETPKSDYLKLYSSVFDCVEVDSSFYHNPGPAMTKGWYKSTPDALGLTFSQSLFLGTAMAVTALPVSVRILLDLNLL